MFNLFYQLNPAERRRILADAGFKRNDMRIWEHSDGRAVGEGVIRALTDEAFYRYLGIDRQFVVQDDGDSILEIDDPSADTPMTIN
ncbi:MAG: hypothetical protein IPM55_23610 [Acidobacteria bacterium]|nr:hypothetical protein [Acidobacteriota bacterium]